MTLKPVGRVLRSTGQFIFYFRKVFMAIPILVFAIFLAKYNAANLPEQVGLLLSQDGTYSVLITRSQAVWWPMILTGGSLILMFVSRKAFYPWLISAVTLIVPILLVILNNLF